MEPQRAVNAHEEIGGLGGPQGQILCWAHSIVLKPAEDSKMEGTKDQYVGTNLQNLFRHLIKTTIQNLTIFLKCFWGLLCCICL